jgi:hypothetical protein
VNYDIASTAVAPDASRPFRSTHSSYVPEGITLLQQTSAVPFVESPHDQEPASPQAAFERFYIIQGALSPRHWLRQGIPVRVFIEGPEFVAEQKNLGIHAFGKTVAEAIFELRDEIVDQYDRLTELGDRVSARLKRQREFLDEILIPLDADS